MATANKMIWQALQKRCSRRRRSRNGIFCECRFFNSPKTVCEHMYGGFDYTCDMRKFVFLLRTKKSCKLQNLPSRTSTLFLSLRIGALFLFWTATKSGNCSFIFAWMQRSVMKQKINDFLNSQALVLLSAVCFKCPHEIMRRKCDM